jgi:hypothetical protein
MKLPKKASQLLLWLPCFKIQNQEMKSSRKFTTSSKRLPLHPIELTKRAAGILLTSAILYSFPAQALTSYLGINNGTGYNTDPDYVDRSIYHTQDLGLGIVRMGMDGVEGSIEGDSFNWSARDAVVKKYLDAGIKIHSVLSARAHVNRDGNYAKWKANFKYYVSNVMARYKGKIFYYIIDNEPDLDYGNRHVLKTKPVGE